MANLRPRPRKADRPEYYAQFEARRKPRASQAPHERTHACRCLRCDELFLAVFETTKFCSATCRTVYNDNLRRDRARRDDAVRTAMDERFSDPYWSAARGETADASESAEASSGEDASVTDWDDISRALRLRLTQG